MVWKKVVSNAQIDNISVLPVDFIYSAHRFRVSQHLRMLGGSSFGFGLNDFSRNIEELNGKGLLSLNL
jgi:hypothetical protein